MATNTSLTTTKSSPAAMPPPRPSTETDDRHHLLANDNSTTPSTAPSLYSTDDTSTLHPASGRSTPRAASIAPSEATTLQTPNYRGFPSEAAYLSFLTQWADSKKYIQPDDTTLVGFYGTTTMETYASRPRVEFGISKKMKERKERKQSLRGSDEGKESSTGRRWSIAALRKSSTQGQ